MVSFDSLLTHRVPNHAPLLPFRLLHYHSNTFLAPNFVPGYKVNRECVYLLLSSGVEDWNTVAIECQPLAPMWQNLAAFLGLSMSSIDQIQWDHRRNVSACLNEVLKRWITHDYRTEKFGLPSWKTLVRAVAKIHKPLSIRLAENHPGNVM